MWSGSEAPACEVGRLARGFREDVGETSSGVASASKVADTHGERDSQRLFRKFGLTLAIPISQLDVEGEDGSISSLPYLKMSDFFGFLLRKYPELLLGGNKRGQEAEALNKRFWDGYRFFHPEHVFSGGTGSSSPTSASWR